MCVCIYIYISLRRVLGRPLQPRQVGVRRAIGPRRRPVLLEPDPELDVVPEQLRPHGLVLVQQHRPVPAAGLPAEVGPIIYNIVKHNILQSNNTVYYVVLYYMVQYSIVLTYYTVIRIMLCHILAYCRRSGTRTSGCPAGRGLRVGGSGR